MATLTDPKSWLDVKNNKDCIQTQLNTWGEGSIWPVKHIYHSTEIFKYTWFKFSYMEKKKFGGENRKLEFEPCLPRKYLH